MSEELKPCPFCGSPARRWGDGERVECSNKPSCCWGWETDTHTNAGFVKGWNRRVPGPATAKVIEWIKVYFDPPEPGPFVEMVCARGVLEAFLAEHEPS